MKVYELQPGDRVNDRRNGKDFWLEVISAIPLDRLIQVTFKSSMGLGSASYHGNAFISAERC
ncbi:MAG: hypothetical protein EKK59_06510 [Neisseriaceae bacterium]|nr:MAG: hypothetical protein EKK59_06510 [Neisseriaceae bacterium]